MDETVSTLNALADMVADKGYRATVEYPGYLCVYFGDKVATFGDSNDTWGGEVYGSVRDYQDGATPVGMIETDLPTTVRDADCIAVLLLRELGKQS
jgi:hypothetical protein